MNTHVSKVRESGTSEYPDSVLLAGCGYLGLRAAVLWVRQGVTVYAITRSIEKAYVLDQSGIRPIVADLAAPQAELVLPAVKCLLWSVGFDRSTGTQRADLWLHGLTRLIAALPSNPSPRRFVYISSTSVYGDADGEQVDELSSPAPTTEGGRACLEAEQLLCTLLKTHHPETESVILRMAGIYGPNRLLRRVEDLRNQVPIAAAPDEWLNLIHVDDAAAMVVHASLNTPLPTVLNVANAGTLTRRQYYTRLAELAGTPPPIFAAAVASDNTRRNSGNKQIVSKFRTDLPVVFEFDNVESGIADAFGRSEKQASGRT